MAKQSEGMMIALARIAEEKRKRTGHLDLGRLGLETWPEPLWELSHLTSLSLGASYTDPNEKWCWAESEISPNRLPWSHARWEKLPRLSYLYLRGDPDEEMYLSEFGTLEGLKINYLDISFSTIGSLEALSPLSSLSSLDCSCTQVADLSPISALTALRSLDCSHSQVANLSPLAALSFLESLDCSVTHITDLSPLSTVISLQSIRCAGTQVADLSPLSTLLSLKSLTFFHTSVADLSPLVALSSLRFLRCFGTPVADLSPLAALQSLLSLDVSGTQVADLAPLAALVGLQSIDCSYTEVASLSPLSKLISLESIECANSPISDISSVSELASLQSLDFSHTQIADLSPLEKLARLQSLDCAHTRISDLTPLSKLGLLRSLKCSGTQVADLAPLEGLAYLEDVACHSCSLRNVPQRLIRSTSLKRFLCHEATISGIASEVLSQNPRDNCLPRLRTHLDDLASGAETLSDLKLLVLGNGRIGKTQICNRLKNQPYQTDSDSTHGITVTSAAFDAETILHVWDFGGQDLYHGTHSLFMRSRALFLLVWATSAENSGTHEHGGMVFRNHPLPYWLSYVHHAAGAESPLLLVQNQCDRVEDEALHPPVEDATLAIFPFRKLLHYSARENSGRAALDESLRQAIAWLRKRQGRNLIGKGRLAVKRRLEALRDADAAIGDPMQRLHRTISQEHFRQLCAEAGGVSEPVHLLDYLHHAGIVFYRPGLFGDQIILDQAWALEAVYAVFNRQKCYRQLRMLRGRFTRMLLEALVWQNHERKEQNLFLSFMESCGICFAETKGNSRDEVEPSYVAPDLLPDYAEVEPEVGAQWETEADTHDAVLALPFAHPGIMRGLLSQIGGNAGIAAIYWKNGVCLYEQKTRSHGRIEQESVSGGVHIVIRTQKGRATELLEMLTQWLTKAVQPTGCPGTWVKGKQIPPAALRSPERGEYAGEKTIPSGEPQFAPPPRKKPTYGVSYAWDDASTELVDRLCVEAETKHDVTILRDRTGMGIGDSIAKFMLKLTARDRVFVILSDKYLKSPFCMYELLQLWNNCRQNDEAFRRRVRIYRQPDAKMMTPVDRARCAKHWKDQFQELDTLVRENGADLLGESDFKRYKLMQDFSHRVGDILAVIADTLQPRDFAALEQHGFGAPSEEPAD